MTFIAKIQNGKVYLVDASSGFTHRQVGDSGAVSASVQGDKVVIAYSNGTTKLYSTQGGYIRPL